MININKSFFLTIFQLIFLFSALSCSADADLEKYPLASPEDLPAGEETKPGKSSGIYLSHYKTCAGYGDFINSKLKVSYFQRLVLGFLQNTNTESCKVSHTCSCKDGQYFSNDLPNDDRGAYYHCIEPASAAVEKENIYKATEKFTGEGVIKFALPKSFCDKQS